jgi:hypothetical protein
MRAGPQERIELDGFNYFQGQFFGLGQSDDPGDAIGHFFAFDKNFKKTSAGSV